MSKKYLVMFLILMASFAFWSCSENLFGSPSGGGKSNCGDKDIECLQVEAEELFRNADYEASYEAYSRIVKADSARSVGYFGMAKAGLWMHRVTIFNFIEFMGGADVGDDASELLSFFMDQEREKLNSYLQGSKKAYRALLELNRRDSLTALCRGNKSCIDNLPKSDKSDMKYSSKAFSSGYVMSGMFYELLGSIVFDTWGNGCIFKNRRDVDSKPGGRTKYGCDGDKWLGPDIDMEFLFKFDEHGTPIMDLESFADNLVDKDGNPDKELVNTINGRLDSLENGMGNLVSLLGGGGEDGKSQEELQQNLEDFKDYALFYKMDDRIDNDGDGCVDEEIFINGKAYDVDGDGISGEDSRVVYIAEVTWENCVNKNGCELNPITPITNPDPKYGYTNKFIVTFQNNEEGEKEAVVRAEWYFEGFWTPSYMALDKTAKMDLKKEIQTEKTKDGFKKCYSLSQRKNAIGGCWNNYSNQDFVDYRAKRKSQEKNDMNPECEGIY